MTQEDFKARVKSSFAKVKNHISQLNSEVSVNRRHIIDQKKVIDDMHNDLKASKCEIEDLKALIEDVHKDVHKLVHKDVHKKEVPVEIKQVEEEPKMPEKEHLKQVSSGNEGVYSFTHSFNRHSFTSHADDYAHKIKDVNEGFQKMFNQLSKQEFLTFLTIYQLEDEISQVSYSDISRKLGLSEGCVRTYVSSLLRKGLPVLKHKNNNRMVLLSISKEFKALNLKQKLADLFYGYSDPGQKTLKNLF